MAALIPLADADRARVASSLERHPDFPKPGILFVDVFSLWRRPELVETVIAAMAAAVKERFPGTTHLAGLESRGFLFGTLLAARLALPFVPVRKAGKLPGAVEAHTYDLEYGSATVELQRSALGAGDRVLLVDDLLATGGTLAAAGALVRSLGATVAGAVVMIELEALGGAAKLGAPVATLLKD
jgi:adenine phosphoribosyltransferase